MVVSTPKTTSYRILTDIMNHPKPRHVLVEKPRCNTVAHCKKVCCNYDFPLHQLSKEQLDQIKTESNNHERYIKNQQMRFRVVRTIFILKQKEKLNNKFVTSEEKNGKRKQCTFYLNKLVERFF